MSDNRTGIRTYEDGVMDTVLFVMEELASGITAGRVFEHLRHIHGSIVDERITNHRDKYKPNHLDNVR